MLIGIDWGGTKIEAIALDPAGAVLARERIPTPQHDYEAGIAAAARLVAGIEARLGRRGSVGIGIPGSLSPATGLIRNANSTWLNGRALDRDMAAALGRAIRVENDANCLAASEAADGAGAGETIVWAVILGTGAGSGLAVDGRVLTGRLAIAGEWAHNSLPAPRDDERPGQACYCGRRGCLETWISGPAFAADHARRTGTPLSAPALIAAMRGGDAAAADSYARYVDRLGRGFAQVVNILDPDVIVLGGGLSEIDELYRDLPAATLPHVFSDQASVRIVKSRHGDSSGVRGAAWLWREHQKETPA